MAEPLTLASLPLFPLGSVLFPQGVLRLQIFEVRYLDLIGKCFKTGAPFGVVSLIQGTEVRRVDPHASTGDGFATEQFADVGTLATITEFEAPQAGLMRVVCRGGERFQIAQRNRLKHGLWMADTTVLAADPPVPVPDDLEPVARALARLIANAQATMEPGEALPIAEPYCWNDCAWVANRWCECLSLPAGLKQNLLQLDNPLLRLELVSDFLNRHGLVN